MLASRIPPESSHAVLTVRKIEQLGAGLVAGYSDVSIGCQYEKKSALQTINRRLRTSEPIDLCIAQGQAISSISTVTAAYVTARRGVRVSTRSAGSETWSTLPIT